MRTVDTIDIDAPLDLAFEAASRVEKWPSILSHYRWVKFLERRADGAAIVEMAANRPFGAFQWPTWWVSEMWVDRAKWEVRYRHIRGITQGMDVTWRLTKTDRGTHIDLVHDWIGPWWSLSGYPGPEWVIGRVFVHGIASRTLAGIKASLEAVRD